MLDESTYGFSKSDASALTELIGLRDEVIPGRRPTRSRGGGGGGIRLYAFTLNATLASGTADADILLMDGTDTTIDANVLDPRGIFASLGSGDDGLCILQDGNYYVIQANCPA